MCTKNTIRDGDSTALYMFFTVYTVYIIQTALHYFSKMYAINIVKVRTLLYLGSMGFRAKCWTVWTGLDWSGYPLNCYDY